LASESNIDNRHNYTLKLGKVIEGKQKDERK